MLEAIGECVVVAATAFGVLVATAFIGGIIVMLAWNYTMPMIFGLCKIGYWHGFALSMLGQSFFKATLSAQKG